MNYVNMKICANKTCNLSGLLQSDNNFYKNNRTKDGLVSRCKECVKEWRKNNPEIIKQWCQDNEEHRREYQKNWQKKHQKEILEKNRKWNENINNRLSRLLKAAHKRSKIKKISSDIDIEWLLEKYNEQNGKCLLTGIEFDLTHSNKKYHRNPFSPSLDRIDNSKGYTKSNTRLVCVWINIAIGEYGEENFLIMIKELLKLKGQKI